MAALGCLHEDEVLTENLRIPSTDGEVGIPVTLYYSRELESRISSFPDRSQIPGHRILVVAYGAYGSPVQPFSALLSRSLLRTGWIIAVAGARGGCEGGPGWHQAGQQERKNKTVEDVAVVTRHLRDRYENSGVVGFGTSAGGGVIGI